MSEREFESQDLYEFITNISDIMSKDKENDNISQNAIKNTINDYLNIIINNKTECQNFFNKLYQAISPLKIRDPSESNRKKKKSNKKLLAIYPIIYSFSPILTINYIDYFLTILSQMITEKNKKHFSFFISVFSEVIDCFYNCNDNNNNINEKQKGKLYHKFLSFINGIMIKNDNTNHYFGCLLLEEFIEKCPLVKEQENTDAIFKEILEYLEDAKIECKYDLLNCIISLILKVEKKFKPFAKVCLFRILDYLTDSDSNKRKLAINIVYILALYCKEEIIVVKDNIIEFLNILKEDNEEEVRKVCLETLKIIENENIKNIKRKNEEINQINYINHVKSNDSHNKDHLDLSDGNIFEFSEESNKEESLNVGIKKIKNEISTIKKNNLDKKIKKIDSYEKGSNINKPKSKSKNKIYNNKSHVGIKKSFIKQSKPEVISTNSFKKKSNVNVLKADKNKTYINFEHLGKGTNMKLNNSSINNKVQSSEIKNRLNKSLDLRTTNYLTKRNVKNKNSKKHRNKDTNEEIYQKFQKEKGLYQEILKHINERKPKKFPLSSHAKKKNRNKIYIKLNDTAKNIKSKKNMGITTKNKEIKKNSMKNLKNLNHSERNYKESIDIHNSHNKSEVNINNNNINEKNDIIDMQDYDEKKENNIEQIIEQNIEPDIEQNIEPDLNKVLEQFNIIQDKQNSIINLINNVKDQVNKNYMILNKRITKIENYINKKNNNLNEYNNNFNVDFNNNEFQEDDYYLYKLLPLISISKLDISIIENIVMKLCLSSYNIKYDQNHTLIMLSFFNQIIRAKINLNANVKKNMQDTLKLLKIENNLQLSQNDTFVIDNIIRATEL